MSPSPLSPLTAKSSMTITEMSKALLQVSFQQDKLFMWMPRAQIYLTLTCSSTHLIAHRTTQYFIFHQALKDPAWLTANQMTVYWSLRVGIIIMPWQTKKWKYVSRSFLRHKSSPAVLPHCGDHHHHWGGVWELHWAMSGGQQRLLQQVGWPGGLSLYCRKRTNLNRRRGDLCWALWFKNWTGHLGWHILQR